VLEVQFTAASSTSAVQYTVYHSPSVKRTVMYSLCGLRESPNKATAVQLPPNQPETGVISVVLRDLLKGVSYDINVGVAQAAHPEEAALYRYTSITVLDDIPGNGGLPIKWLLGIGLPVFLIILAVVIYLIVRNRKLTKELEFEMQDAPKSAVRKAVIGPQGFDAKDEFKANKQSKTYSRLLTSEEDDELADTDYNPPPL
jgi:hypothetical protein